MNVIVGKVRESGREDEAHLQASDLGEPRTGKWLL